jgi:phage terminase large subunit
MSEVRIRIPPKLVPVFEGDARYRCAFGGRGSGKTQTFATMAAVKGYQFGRMGRTGQILCAREHLNSLESSSLPEVKAAIAAQPFLAAYYEIGDKFIRSHDRRIEFTFSGLRHNLDSIKSRARILLSWVAEAEGVPDVAWRKLIPTVREHDSEIWAEWNPESEHSATHQRFRVNPPANAKIVEVNYADNPWFPAVLEQERLDDLIKRPDTYDHVWGGKFLTMSDAQIFAGFHTVEAFEPGRHWTGPYYGMDFGFAQDPTCAVEVWVDPAGVVHFRREAGKVGLELDDTAQFFMDRMPGIERHAIRADSARPESISYLKRGGPPSAPGSPPRPKLPLIEGVKKGPGSVQDGVDFLKASRVVIHPDCPETAREARLYSFKVDRLSGDVLPIIVDAHNHFIDSGRYAVQPLIKVRAAPGVRAL